MKDLGKTSSGRPRITALAALAEGVALGARGGAFGALVAAFWTMLEPLSRHTAWVERFTIASGLVALYALAGAVLGALVASAAMPFPRLRSKSGTAAGALAGALVVSVWVRPPSNDATAVLVGIALLPLFAWISSRSFGTRTSLFALVLIVALPLGSLALQSDEELPLTATERTQRLSPGAGEGFGSWPANAPRPRHVIMLVIDTLRADHLGAYGYARETSPHLDRVAAEGVRFDAAIVQRPKTSPSVASILTGLYPHSHGLSSVRSLLPLELDTLAEHFGRAGFETAGFVSNINLFRRFQFDQGFDVYEEFGEGKEVWGSDHAELVNEGIERWLDERESERRDAPFFLYVHYMDPHSPYAPPESFDEDLFVGDALYGRYSHLDVPIGKGYVGTIDEHLVLEDGSRDIDLYVARYDAEIAYCDREIGRLLGRLRDSGLLDESLLVVTSDHGESMTEHGVYFNHGLMPYENNIRVPLIMRHPALPAGSAVADVVQSIDLAPTLLDALELGAPSVMDGETLVPLLFGSGRKELDVAYAEAGKGKLEKTSNALRGRTHKLILFNERVPRWYGSGLGARELLLEIAFEPRRWFVLRSALKPGRDSSSRWEFYDLAADPAETTNLAGDETARLERLEQRLRPFREAALEERPDLKVEESDVDDQTLELLRSLGYVQ